MRKIFLFSAVCLALTACGIPAVDVKKRWNAALVSYSFVPIYPARSDVNIGDVRIHTVEVSAEALDSRLISDYKDNKLAKDPTFAVAVLPGIEALRLVSVDTEGVGLSGFLRRLLGSRVNAASSLYVSLQDLSTAEVADKDIAKDFVEYLKKEANASSEVPAINEAPFYENKFIWGLCAAAKSLKDPNFEDLGISVVTRVARAKRIAYYSGSSLSNLADPNQATAPPTDPEKPGNAAASAAKNPSGNTFIANTGSSLPVQNLKEPVVVGVDALMIYPKVVLPDLVKRCAEIEPFFVNSQLSKLRNRSSSAGRPN